jgi:MFS family permease
MLADMIIITAGACTSALANGPTMLFVGQLLVGIGVGIDFPVNSSYVSEILSKPSRARMMVATIACQSVGMLLATAATLILLRSGSAQAWRLFLATEAAVALLFFVLRMSAFSFFLLPILKEKFGVPSVLGILSGVSLLGLLVTLIFKCEDTE